MALRHKLNRFHPLTTKLNKSFLSTPTLSKHFQSTDTDSGSKEIIYVNPTHGLDGYELINSPRTKPSIPVLGFGTMGYDHFSADQIAQAVDIALKTGYRHIDCARLHTNEKEIGAVITDHLVNGTCTREELFITSKLFNNEHAPPDGAPLRALEMTLKDLNLSYIDLFSVHWPFRNSIHSPPLPFNLETWFFTYKLMSELNMQGLAKSVGVCNASLTKMKGLINLCQKYKVSKPANLQIELHPYLQQEEVLQFAEDHDIIVTAAMPLGSPERSKWYRRG